MTLVNHRFTLAARPTGLPKSTDFAYGEEPVRPPGDGELVVKLKYISLDPAMRGWMNEGKSYVPPVKLGETMRALAIGDVIESKDPGFAAGDLVVGVFGVQEYATVAAKQATKVPPIAPAPLFISTLGMPGLTAYFGLLEIGKPKAGETVVVSGAAGAVGAVVGQIAKIKGCRVVGIAGGAEKCAYITGELGFDAAIDYKATDVGAALREHCPKGIDIYFDNVGGDILDAALARLAMHARVIICGAISQYNAGAVKGPANYLSLLVNRASMTGMVVFDYAARYQAAIMEMAGWMGAGTLKSKEDIVKGLETFPDTLLKLFKGENLGKLILEV
ncbi:MAG: NADP-dependent oxidoreductase [Kofleriaceae bacterium]